MDDVGGGGGNGDPVLRLEASPTREKGGTEPPYGPLAGPSRAARRYTRAAEKATVGVRSPSHPEEQAVKPSRSAVKRRASPPGDKQDQASAETPVGGIRPIDTCG
jgi:hypothetical protein